MMDVYRTTTCGSLSVKDVDREVILSGWVYHKRDHGGVVFYDLRDRSGIVQVVFEPTHGAALVEKADRVPRESVIRVRGRVRRRPKGMENLKLSTGEIEVEAFELDVLSRAKSLPVDIDMLGQANEETRLSYRYLDLRRQYMQEALIKRHEIAMAVRDYLSHEGFIEVETPFLTRSTPEGARDFLVPSRLHRGKFYALPQSPQLFKQLLMVAGYDRYFQLARCFRDEDLRSDRQPEFTQIDIEMSFVNEEDVQRMTEGLIAYVAEKVFGRRIELPFPRMSYADAMERYGSDKPDVRFGLELRDVTDSVRGSSFGVFERPVSEGKRVIMLAVPHGFTRREIDDLIAFAQQQGAEGMAWMRLTSEGLESNITKYFREDQLEALRHAAHEQGVREGVLFFMTSLSEDPRILLGRVRQEIARRLNLYDPQEWKFLWITDFPLVEWNEDEQRWDAMHHPFTSPKSEDIPLLDTDIGRVRARAYDITMNGWEIGGGSIRIHDQALQEKMFQVLGLDEETVQRRFGWFLQALQYGVPPHGGIAFGFDRFVALLLGREHIRDVIAFPKNKAAFNPMDGSPSEVSGEQLDELGITLKKK